MEKKNYKINIIGAGVSGLIAAQILENFGYHPTIIEKSDSVGGRVKTEIVNGHRLDVGFQVLLEAYPKAKEYLNLEKLNLQAYKPGASIYLDCKWQNIGDPLRSFDLLIPTLFNTGGSISDKWKVFQLSSDLKSKSLEAIFEENEITTHEYLINYGFSDKIIQCFFQPFFSGIFLEDKLETSSRMFQFIYKMFSEGKTSVPKDGIGAIPLQLKENLKHTQFKLNTPVKSVEEQKITLENGEVIESHFNIIATEASDLVSNLKNQATQWRSCDNLYFLTEENFLSTDLIGLLPHQDTLINNFVFVEDAKAKEMNKHLLSITVVKKHELTSEDLVKRIQKELKNYLSIQKASFLKHYYIPRSLPKLTQTAYEIMDTETQLTPSIYLAGDQLLNGSLNAAMMSGERAALGVIKTLEDGLVVNELTSEYR